MQQRPRVNLTTDTSSSKYVEPAVREQQLFRCEYSITKENLALPKTHDFTQEDMSTMAIRLAPNTVNGTTYQWGGFEIDVYMKLKPNAAADSKDYYYKDFGLELYDSGGNKILYKDNDPMTTLDGYDRMVIPADKTGTMYMRVTGISGGGPLSGYDGDVEIEVYALSLIHI